MPRSFTARRASRGCKAAYVILKSHNVFFLNLLNFFPQLVSHVVAHEIFLNDDQIDWSIR